jgi:hypothetical protein
MTYLEGMGEGVLLPVSSIIGKLDLSIKVNMDVIQPRQVKRLSNDICMSLGQVECTSLVRPLQALVELRRNIIMIVLGSPDGKNLAVAALGWRRVLMFLTKLIHASRNTSRKLNSSCKCTRDEGKGGNKD